MDLFNKRKEIVMPIRAIKQEELPHVPEGMWEKCPGCGAIQYSEELYETLRVCPGCNYHFRLGAKARIRLTADDDSFIEMDSDLKQTDPLQFGGYKAKLKNMTAFTGLTDAIMTGRAKIEGTDVILGAMDPTFMMGSMGTVLGERVTRAVETATEERKPIVLFTASGGARMQEGILSLMQMAKVSGALSRHDEAGLLYISVLTDPTTGGVTASFASLGDIVLAEPKALVGFAGKRVIAQTIGHQLPDEFQTAEFQLQKGFVDAIVPRADMREALGRLLKLHTPKEVCS